MLTLVSRYCGSKHHRPKLPGNVLPPSLYLSAAFLLAESQASEKVRNSA